MPNEKAVCEIRPDYEREYYRLIELVERLENENAELKETLIGICKSAFTERRC